MVDHHFLSPSTLLALPPELVEAFCQPFAPHEVRLRVGKRRRSVDGEGWECTAVPVLSRQVIEARLNTLVPGGWSTSSPSLVVTADRVTVSACVTIGVTTHTDYGEVSLTRSAVPDETEELLWSVPEAFEHALFRACARFGLGRSLTSLAREWVPYDAEHGRIALSSAQQQAHILKLYQQANIPLPFETSQPGLFQPEEPARSPTREEALLHGTRGSSTPFDSVTRESLRARDLTWVQHQCAAHPKSLPRILSRWKVQRLEDLSDAQLHEVIKSIHRSRARSAQALARVS
jgi:hypothetical protein